MENTVQHTDGYYYDQKRIEDEDLAVFVRHLTSHGYGVPPTRVLEILSKLTPEDRADLMYVCQRAAEKIGESAFDFYALR